jgi:uncharacterized protein
MNIQNLSKLLNNVISTRQAWLSKMIDPRRDLSAECGHPLNITTEDYTRAFRRGDLARRVISLFPDECWSDHPYIYETEGNVETAFEITWKELNSNNHVFSYLHRVDVLSGIGRFGILLIGIDDGLPMHMPAAGIGEDGVYAEGGVVTRKVIYFRALDESKVRVKELQNDISSPRYGLPVFYEVTLEGGTNLSVHWSRVLHVADNRLDCEVYGSPRLEVCFDRLLDLHKVAGGSGEMFWKGGFPGISIEAPVGGDIDIEFDPASTKEQMEAYMNGLQRYIALVGLSAKSLTTQIADPRPHMETQVRLIAMALGVPWRILMGVEVGQLASQQDATTWNKRLNRRREEYLTPYLIRPLLNRLIGLQVLPQPTDILVEWKDLNSPADLDKADVAEKRTAAIADYVQSGVDAVITPYHYLTIILGMSDEEAESILEETGQLNLDRVRDQHDDDKDSDEEESRAN